MPFWKILLYGFLLYLAYRFVFGFIIPVYRTTRQVKKQFREINERMKEYMNQQQEQFSPKQKDAEPKEKPGDYIEFEEIK